MKKPLVVAFAALVVLGAGGYAGVHFYAQHQARSVVEEALASLRKGGARAQVGSSSVSLADRRLVLGDLSVTSADGAATLQVKQLTAAGVGTPQDGRITADRMEMEGVTLTRAGDGGEARLEEELPRVVIEAYAGPLVVPPTALGKAGDPMMAGLDALATLSARQIVIPHAVTRMTPADPAAPPLTSSVDGVAITDLDAGRIGRLAIARLAMEPTPRTGTPAGTPQAAKGTSTGPRLEMADLSARDIDLRPLMAEPGAADSAPQPLVGLIETGRFVSESVDGIRTEAAGLRVTELAARPGALTAARIDALRSLSRVGGEHTAASARLDEAAALVKAVRFGAVEIRELATIEPDGRGHAALLALEKLEDGRLDEVRFESMDGDSDGQNVKFGRLALTGLDLPRVMTLAQAADPTAPDAAFSVFRTFSGFVATDLELPTQSEDGSSGTPVRIARIALGWELPAGTPAAELPERIHFELKDVTGPIDAENGEPFNTLAAAGMTHATFSLALGGAYDAGTGAITVSPAEMEVKNAFRIRLAGQLDNLPAEALRTQEAFAAALPGVDLGPFTLTLTDLGLAPLVLERLAAAEGMSVEDYRGQLIELMEALIAQLSPQAPEAAAVGEALAAFIKDPKTVVFTVTPKGRVPLLALINSDDPTVALQLLGVTASYQP